MVRYIKIFLTVAAALMISELIIMYNEGIFSEKQTDPEFAPFIKEFESHYGQKIKSTIVFVDKMKGTVIGVCYYITGRIKISKEYWNRADYIMREALIFHELGHCDLKRNHDKSTIIKDGREIYKSLMFPKMPPLWMYQRHREYYIKELFSP